MSNLVLSIEDLIKPIRTKANKFGLNLGMMFEKLDLDKNHRVSVNEIKLGFEKHNIKLSNDDLIMLKEYFYNKYDPEHK